MTSVLKTRLAVPGPVLYIAGGSGEKATAKGNSLT